MDGNRGIVSVGWRMNVKHNALNNAVFICIVTVDCRYVDNFVIARVIVRIRNHGGVVRAISIMSMAVDLNDIPIGAIVRMTLRAVHLGGFRSIRCNFGAAMRMNANWGNVVSGMRMDGDGKRLAGDTRGVMCMLLNGTTGANIDVRMTTLVRCDPASVHQQVRIKLAHMAFADHIGSETELVGACPFGNGNPFVGDL